MLLASYQTFIIHFCVLLELVPSVLPQYLFRASVGGEGNTRPSYIYGGPLDHFDDGKQSNLYEFTLDNINTVSADNYRPQRLTTDPLTDYFLVEYKSKNGDKLLVARGDLCGGGSQDLKTQIANIELADSNNRYFMDENCGTKCGWGAFTLFNGSIYFVVSGVLGESHADLKREIQLRKLDVCDKQLRMAAIGSGFVDFQILTCSSHVATIYSEDYAWPNPTIGAWSSGSLLATDINNDDHPEFFLQLVHDNNNEVDMRLIQVRTSPNKETTVETLYTAPVDDQYGGNWQFASLGEVTYRSGTLCWTAAEQLICGLIEYNQATDSDVITDTNILLQSEEAYSANICRGQTSPLPYGHVITGVAIASTAEPLAVYFGCYSEQTTVGGTGMVRVSSIGSKQISGVYSGNTRLLSGSVMATDYFGDCKQSPAIMKTTQVKDPEVATDITVIATECSNHEDANQPQPVTLHADNIYVHFKLILVCTVVTLLRSL